MKQQNVTHTYREGEYVVYRSSGLCRVIGVRTECFDGVSERTYYEMNPVDQAGSSFFVPADLPDLDQRMRRILSKQQIMEIISVVDDHDIEWIEDAKVRFETFDGILKAGDRAQILRLLKLLEMRRTALEMQRKKLYAGDARILNNAQRLLTQEFAFVLGIEQDRVIPFIIEHLAK